MESIVCARSLTLPTTSGSAIQCFSILCQAWETQIQLTRATRFSTTNGLLLTSLQRHFIIKRVQDTTCLLKSQLRTPTKLLTAQAFSTLLFSKTFGFNTTFQAGPTFSQLPTLLSICAMWPSTLATADFSPTELQGNTSKALMIL